MDQQRFDDLARTLGATRSRRQTLKLLTGAALGGVLGTRGLKDAAAACLGYGATCTTDAACCSQNCIDANHKCGCPVGKRLCNGRCVNPKTDETNCGACGVRCDPGETCANGTCCPTGMTSCSGVCTDLRTDEQHCGSCATACAAGKVCSRGTCCPSGQVNCGVIGAQGVCVNRQTNPNNCGTCGHACAAGEICYNGQCVCARDCAGKACGPDGCGGFCGQCAQTICKDTVCQEGRCVSTPIPGCCNFDADCDDGNPCTIDTCNLDTRTCQNVQVPDGTACGSGGACRSGTCCTPSCVGKVCGNDGCGGSCGSCGTHQSCSDGQCVATCAGLQQTCDPEATGSYACCQDEPTFCVPNFTFGSYLCCRPYQGSCTFNSDCCGGLCRTDATERHCGCSDASGCPGQNDQCINNVCCTPASKATTCAGKCGSVTNNCGQQVDCGLGLQQACTDAGQCCQMEPTFCASKNGSVPYCCRADGGHCAMDNDCCSGRVCQSGLGTCCRPARTNCDTSDQCCGSLVCRNGRCCGERGKGITCTVDQECCSGLCLGIC